MDRPLTQDEKGDWVIYAYHLEDKLSALQSVESTEKADNSASLQLLFSKWNSIKKPNGEWQHAVCNFIRWAEEQQQA